MTIDPKTEDAETQKPANSFDLNMIDVVADAERGARMTLRDPRTDKPIEHDRKEMWIECLGADSQRYTTVEAAIRDRRTGKIARTGKIRTALSASQTDNENLEMISKCMTGWFIYLDGEETKFSEAEARRVIDRYRWIFDQVNAFMGERENFMLKS